MRLVDVSDRQHMGQGSGQVQEPLKEGDYMLLFRVRFVGYARPKLFATCRWPQLASVLAPFSPSRPHRSNDHSACKAPYIQSTACMVWSACVQSFMMQGIDASLHCPISCMVTV